MSNALAPGRLIHADRRAEPIAPRFLRRFLALDDFEIEARKRLPRQIFGYYAGAAETNQSLEANARTFRELEFVPRVLRNVSNRSIAHDLFGRQYRMPIGICPMGLSGLSTFQGDMVLARAAVAENIPMVVSATSIIALERLAEVGARWFQAYLPGDEARIDAMIGRVTDAGYDTLVLTADVPVPANRENNIRAGFSIPLQPSLRLLWDGLSHPRWAALTFGRTILKGMPRMENMDAFRGPPILSRHLVRALGARDALSCRSVDFIRRRWSGRFVLKGVLAPEDARVARECGVDAIWVSNHGGRQLDGAVAPLRVLPAIKSAAGDTPVLIDGGFRRGTHVLKAMALGADFVFVGRPFLYAAAAAGLDGGRHAIGLLAAEIDRDLALLGLSDIGTINTEYLRSLHDDPSH